MSRSYPEALESLSRAWPRLDVSATIRSRPEDFIVDEQLGFTPDGEGEHVLLHVRKRNLNTDQVARMLARHAGLPRKVVSYAGMKDRNALTSQYFSIHMPGVRPVDEPDWTALENEQLAVLAATRHSRKLRRGALTGNRFQLRLCGIESQHEILQERLTLIAANGVPNYFMAQRFGHAGNNLARGEAMLLGAQRVRDRHLRGLYLSATRSWLFNQVLSARVDAHNWNQALEGDSMMLDHSRACFSAAHIDEDILRRLASGEIHPTGPLWGRGQSMVSGAALETERAALSEWQAWMAGLEKAAIDMARRRLRMNVAEIAWSWPEDDVLQLSFELAPGCYATAMLRELCSVSEP
jgi:tRNA pseudouridine13 synthase